MLSRQALYAAKRLVSPGSGPSVVVRSFSSVTPGSLRKDNEASASNKDDGRREIHSTPPEQSDAMLSMAVPSMTAAQSAPSIPRDKAESTLMDRFVVTAEVTVSKIFPAGFGWQTAGTIAASANQAPDSLNFALCTGLGDALGVLLGHVAFYATKKALLRDQAINMTRELHTGILLGSAAFCSGTAWQPLVNALQGADLPFAQVFLGTWAGCGLAFYGGLRVTRTLLSGKLQYVHEPTYENSKNDASLSVAIGGATGFFVGTDTAYLPDQNFLIHLVGIREGTSDMVASTLAGSSTSLGFLSAQTTMNLIYPRGKCWND
jgi:hypothetical protein